MKAAFFANHPDSFACPECGSVCSNPRRFADAPGYSVGTTRPAGSNFTLCPPGKKWQGTCPPGVQCITGGQCMTDAERAAFIKANPWAADPVIQGIARGLDIVGQLRTTFQQVTGLGQTTPPPAQQNEQSNPWPWIIGLGLLAAAALSQGGRR
jgi:hypothetical protein